jgi:hypothetical protein
MHGDRLAHSPACARHAIAVDCPVDRLAPLLPSRVLARLARAEGRRGEPVASCGTPATVGDLVRLYCQSRLGEIGGLGRLSIRGIGVALVSHGLVAAEEGDAITPYCPVDCLRSVLSGRVLNRLAHADGRGVPVAPGGPPTSVGDVIRLYCEDRLGEIAGLGAHGISEIEAGLVFAGLLLSGSTPVRQQPRTRATAPGLAAVTAGTGQSAAPGSRRRRPGTGSG